MRIKKKQTLLCFFAIVTLIGTLILAPACSEENIITVNPSSEPLTREETRAMTEKAAEAFYADPALRDELESEITLKMEIVPAEGLPDDELAVYTLTHGGKSMRFFMETFGEPDENGRFPLYIVLHGGGDASAEFNNNAWIFMAQYYRDAVENGILVTCRGITDTWDLHFQEDSYPPV